MQPAIRVQNISKRYEIGARQQSYTTLRESIMDMVAAPARGLRRWARHASARNGSSSGPETPETMYALRDIGFDVLPGEVIGIIGRNGAGKSTLLKILSRITQPTTGRVELRGRVGSLLEVGTGFHPELTGRDNISLNGAVLGMSRREIARKFDDIVAFAEVDRFLDTPVKRYSSGMYVRLAFAVAAHLQPEILLVDEVLAVGDMSFQRKCLTKMQDVGREGRTVVFVSHNMAAITRLCSRAILLDDGRVVCDGPAHRVAGEYLRAGLGTTAAREWPDLSRAPGNDVVRLRHVRVRTETGEIAEAIDIRRPVGIEMQFDVLRPGHVLVPNYHVFNEEGACVFVASDLDPAWRRRPRPTGRCISTAWIPGNLLAEGTLVVGAAISTMDPVVVHVFERDAVAFQVVDSLDGDSARGDYAGPIPGIVRPLLRWSTRCGAPDESAAMTVGAEL